MPSDSGEKEERKLPIQPIERLTWEHGVLLREIGEFDSLLRGKVNKPADLAPRAAAMFRFLERHQDSEERFLFPLLHRLGDELFTRLRKEHVRFIHESEAVLSAIGTGDLPAASGTLGRIRAGLHSHFEGEESVVFMKSADLLSHAQMDILRINFATRESPVL